MKKVRIVVVNDSDPLRLSLIALLRHLPQVTVVGEAKDGEVALRSVDELDPDLLLLDLQMPKLNGWQVLHQLHLRGARVKVFILSSHAPSLLAPLVAERGAAAYLSKDSPQAIMDAIAALAKELDTVGS